VPVLQLVDQRLALDMTDGWYYEDMPEDAEAWRVANSRSNNASAVACSAGEKKLKSGWGSRRANTTPAVTSSQRFTSESTSKSAKRPLPPGVTARRDGGRNGTVYSSSPSRRSNAASKPMPPTIAASSGANAGGPISML
jgi:hypothetical protein